MAIPLEDELYVQTLGWEVLNYLKSSEERLLELRQAVDRDALRVLEKIQCILNDDTVDDPECFERIEAIVKTFHENNLSTTRHDWG